MLPERNITKEEAEKIFQTAEIVRNGKLIQEVESILCTSDRAWVESVGARAGNRGFLKAVSLTDEVVDILGQPINLGPSLKICRKVMITPEHSAQLQQQLQNPNQMSFEVAFTADGVPLEQYFPRWLPKTEAEAVEKQMVLPK